MSVLETSLTCLTVLFWTKCMDDPVLNNSFNLYWSTRSTCTEVLVLLVLKYSFYLWRFGVYIRLLVLL